MSAKKILMPAQALLSQLAQQQRPLLQRSVLCGALATILLVASWALIAVIAQRLLAEQQPWYAPALLLSLMGLLVLLLSRAWLQQQQELLAGKASINARLQLRQQLLSHWQQQAVWQLQQQSPAVHATKWLEDVEAMEGYFARYWPQRQLMLLSPLIILLAVLWTDWLVALLLFIAAPLIPLFMSLIGMGAEQINQQHILQRQRLAGHFLNRLRHIPLLLRLGVTAQIKTELAGRSEQYRHLLMRTLKLAFLSSAVLEFFSSVAIAALAMYIGFALYGAISWGPATALTLGSGLFMLALAPEFFQPLRQFAQSYHDKASALAAATELAAVFTATASPISTRTTITNNTTLKIKDLAIAQPGGELLQKGLCAEVHTGQCLLISGRSGIGKSTLLQTLAGLLPPAKGAIRIQGQAVSVVQSYYQPQQPWIMQGSIRENLLLLCPAEERPSITTEQLMDVLRKLNLHSICPDVAALDKPLSERGEGLSGGQLQRLALARALLRPAPYVLLDEPTSALDIQNRQYVIAQLAQLKTRCILVIVSHEPELQVIADVHWQLEVGDDAAI